LAGYRWLTERNLEALAARRDALEIAAVSIGPVVVMGLGRPSE
jgi:hypothetical protein